jgi:hypothetical protein
MLLLLLSPANAYAIGTEVSTGIYFYPGDEQKMSRASAETAEDGLRFVAPRPARDVAKDYADEELKNGNVCLRQLKRDLHSSLKKWQVRDLCEKIFHDHVDRAVIDAAREKLHPDHVECSADAEAREKDGKISLALTFRGQLVMRDRAPPKLRRAGIGGELTRWDLPGQSEALGAAGGSWKDVLRTGACSADEKALQRFWDRIKQRADQAREIAECRDGRARAGSTVARLQAQLRDYVPEEWVKERAGDDYDSLMKAPVSAGNDIASCRAERGAVDQQLEKLRKLSTRIADKYDVPALDPEARRAPASEDGE